MRVFNGKLRDECLSGEIFHSLKEAIIVIEQWRKHYNTRGLQIGKYEEFISKNEEALTEAYISVCETLIELRKQGLNRTLDPIIEGVANGIPLTIHPHVYLLVYAYGRDEENGALKNRLETLRAKDKLGHHVIAKGNAGGFALSKDIRSRL